MLACVFRAERFHTYVFGRSFTIESDHKPLEQINLKNLTDTPARLQRMLLRLQNYNVKITYCPGREMLAADTLSCYTLMPALEVALDLAIHHMHITPEKKLAFQQSIQDDPLLRSLAETIIAGWPEDIKDLPNALRPYHIYRDVMTVEDGLILRGEALIIPPSERGKVLESIHEGHLGISKCQFRARQCVYWPGINADIRKMVEACPTCQRHHPQEPRQPLQSTPAPERPWQHLGADYFSFDGSEYLVIVDYYTKMPFVQKMSPSQCNSARMIAVLKELFAEHGIPEVIRMDNGPQFASHLFAEFTKDWNIDHTRSSPRNLRSNGQAESAVKIVKGLLTRAKFSGQDPYLALLAYRSTPVDAHLRSPAEMLYQHAIWLQYHRGSGTRTPEPNRTENDSTTELPRVLHTMTVTPGPSHHSTLDKQSQCSMMPRPFGYPPPSSDKQPMDPTWLKSSSEDVTDEPMTTSVSDTQMS